MNESLCILYSTGYIDIEKLENDLSEYLNLKKNSISFFESDLVELVVNRNDEFNDKRQRKFPDGFLFFKFIIEFYFKDKIVNDDHIMFVTKTLKWLWDKGMPAVASCDYEERLPHAGGYKDASLPWPK